jgi:hypothetical protein
MSPTVSEAPGGAVASTWRSDGAPATAVEAIVARAIADTRSALAPRIGRVMPTSWLPPTSRPQDSLSHDGERYRHHYAACAGAPQPPFGSAAQLASTGAVEGILGDLSVPKSRTFTRRI